MLQIVIKIPNFEWLENEEDFKEAVKEYSQGTKFDKEIRNALLNGTPLPKGHGRLIDLNDLYALDRRRVEYAPTIIEAEKGVLEKINEKQDSLRATCKAWDEAIEKDGYVE